MMSLRRPKLRGITGEECVEILDRIGNYIERNSKPPADPMESTGTRCGRGFLTQEARAASMSHEP